MLRVSTPGRGIRWAGLGLLACASAWGQAYRTPVRASWTEEPATTATLTWDTPTAARGTVRYGLTTNYSDVVHDGGGTHLHVVTLRDLAPGTRYFYEASASDGSAQAATFRTAPLPGAPLEFIIHGDLQGGIDEAGAQGVSDRIVQADPPFVIHLGDMAEEQFSDTGFATWEIFFRIVSNELARTVFLPILGNHDTAPGEDYCRALFQRIFSLPEPSLGNGYYAHTVGNVRFIGLMTDIPAQDQSDWLARELQAAANDTNVVWIIGLCHRPPYSWGERLGDDHYKTNWTPLLTSYEADWLISGHSHNYQRTVPIRGVRYLVAGGGGGRLYESAVAEPAHAFATTCYHYVSAHVTNDVMTLRAIRSDGLEFDGETVTNRRQVRVEPAFPLRGEPAKILYRATEGPLVGADPVYIHLGIDAFTNALGSQPMTWNAARQRWEYEFTVPATATQRVAFVFRDHGGPTTNWHNNHERNWQALIERASVRSAPVAGSSVVLRYEADMGPLAGASGIQAWVSFNRRCFPAPGPVDLVNVGGARWEASVALPDFAEDLNVHFTGGGAWDDNHKRRWTFPVAQASQQAWPPAPIAANDSPVITTNPPGVPPDNVGDNFDLTMLGPPLEVLDGPRGFGDFGSIWVNVDATNLYLGGYGMDLVDSNNVVCVFVGVETLNDNAWNLWHKSGLPNALDFLHNLRFTEPMDVAILLGDTYADNAFYANFDMGGNGGYNFGQGVFYVGTNQGGFVPMTNAKVSQFHGTGATPTATGGDAAQRRTTRWEVALPWSSLDAAGLGSVSNLFIGGVIASATVAGDDRYLSRTVLAEAAWGLRDGYRQYALNTLTLRPQRVNLLHGDLRGDGISNAWRQEHFETPAGPPGHEDTDRDGQDNRAEEIAGTDPRNNRSFFAMLPAWPGMSWPAAPGRTYDVDFTPVMLQPFALLATGLATNAYTPESDGFYRVRVRK